MDSKLSIGILGALIVVLTAASHSTLFGQRPAESAWPTYRGNLKRTGRSDFKGPSTNEVKWIFSTGRAEKEGGIETDPIIGPDGAVYIGANNGIFYALEPRSGDVRWAFITEFDTFAIYSTPFVDQNRVIYFGAKDGNVYAVRSPKRGIMGELVWSYNLGTTIQTSPAVTPDGTLVIGADDWAYYGITPPKAGRGPEVKWRFQTQGTLISSPTVDSDGTVFVASMDGKVYALEPPKEAGRPVKVRWSFSSGARDEKGGFENAPVLDNERTLYIGGNEGIFYALDAGTGKIRWTFDAVARAGYRTYAIFSSAALGPERTIYFGGKNGDLYALRERAGLLRTTVEVLWRYRLGAGIQSSPLLAADGAVYIGDEKGTLHAVLPARSAEGAKALWKFATKGTLISSPTLSADGTLYIGSMDGKLYAFNSPAASPAPNGTFSGTWYGTYESPLFSGKVRAVARQTGSQLAFTWFLEGVGRGEAQGVVKGDRLDVSSPIRTLRCQGNLKGDGRLAKGEIRAEVQIDRCLGNLVKGQLRLRKQ